MASRRTRVVALTATTALLLSLAGGLATPAEASSPVQASDTLRSGPGLGWGRNDHGQAAPALTANPSLGPTQLPAGAGGLLGDAVSVAAGNGFALWVDHKGMAWGIGTDALGQLGNHTTTTTDQRTPVRTWGFGSGTDPKAVKVAAYGTEGLALDANGAVWHWGKYLCTATTSTTSPDPTKLTFPSGTTRIIDIAAGNGFALAMDDTGKVYSWGVNDHGQLGQGTTTGLAAPTRIATIPALLAGQQAYLDAGSNFAVYTLTTGSTLSVQTWGANASYQLGYPSSTADQKTPRTVLSLASTAKVLSVSAGATHALLLTTDGVVRQWGSDGLTALTSPATVSDPGGALNGLHHPYAVAAGDNDSFATSTDGTVAAWGVDTSGQLGRSVTGNLTQPTLITVPFTNRSNGVNVPALITSHNNATYAVADGESLRSPDMFGYDFGSFSTTSSASQTPPSHTFTITNVATKPVTISSVIIDGNAISDYVLGASTCTGTLAIDGTCTVVVTFKPGTGGARNAALNIRESNTLGGVAMQTFVSFTGRGYTPVSGLGNRTYAYDASSSSNVSGPGNNIALTGLSPSLIPGSLPATAAAPLGKAPLGKAPLGKAPLGKAPLGKAPLGKAPLGKAPLGKAPLSATPLGKAPLGKAPLGKAPLGKAPLSQFPLLKPGGWTDFLYPYPALRNVPPSALTFADLQTSPKNLPDTAITTALPLERLTLQDLDLADSPFANLSLLDFLMGSARLDQYGGVNWCADLPRLVNGGTCNDDAGLQRTLFDLDAQGVSIDTTRAPLITVGALVTDAASTSTNPLDDTLVGGVSLASVTLGGTHIGQIPLSSLANLSSIVICGANGFDCTNLAGKTLGDVPQAQLQPGATFKDLGTTLNPITLGQLVEPFLDRSSFSWELLPAASIPPGAYPNRETVVADVDLNCLTQTSVKLTYTAPAGFVSVPGTTVLTNTRGTGTTLLADPVVSGQNYTVAVPDSTFGASGPIACTDDSAHLHVTSAFLPPSAKGVYSTSATWSSAQTAASSFAFSPINVTGVSNPPDDTPDGPLGNADTLIFGTVTTPGKVAYIPFLAPAGKIIEASISNQTADFDGVLYYPKGAVLDPALSPTTPALSVPFGEDQAGSGDVLHPAQTTTGGALQDIPLLTDRLVAAVAATRGTDVEQLSAIARAGNDTRHVLAVSGYNGATGSFTVRLRLSDPASLASCSAPTLASGSPAAQAFYNSSGYATGDNTVVLVNTARMVGRYGSAATQTMLDALYSYTHSSVGGVQGQVLQVDSSASVQSAYQLSDASPCDPVAADGVTRAIDALVYPSLPSTVKYVVIAGGDEIIPHARLEDHTRDGNEREQAGDLALTGGNPEAAAMAAGYYLSDDPYGTRVPQTVLGQVVYLPQAITSRLGETAADITASAKAFVTNSGVADPNSARSALVTDYDYLTTGGNQTATALAAAGYTVDHTLTAPKLWRKSDLVSAFTGKNPVPSVAAINGHYDQYRTLPAYGNATGDQSELFSTADVTANLDRRLIFTIGCHSALDVPDSYAAGDARTADFAQTYLHQGAAGLIGNLGFGYADTSTVAYGAQLQSYFAQGLGKGYDLGTALSESKRLYVDRLAGLSGYDLKSAQELILWGLPQYRLSTAPARPAPVAPVTAGAPDPFTGLTSQTLSVGTSAKPLTFSTVNDGSSTHLTAASQTGDTSPYTVAVPGEPVLPAQFVDVPQVNGKAVRSVVPVGLVSTGATTVTATFARASVDHGQTPESQSTGVFPATLGHVGTGNGSNTLVVTPAQFFAAGTTPGAGQLRTFPQSSWLAYYGTPGDSTPPTISGVNGTRIPASGGTPATTSYAIDVTPASGRTLSRVFVLALPAGGSGAWVKTELVHGAGTRWNGGAAGLLGEFIVVAIDSNGDAALSTQKGLGWQPADLPAGISGSYPVQLSIAPGAPASGWFTSNPTVTITSNGGSTSGYQLSIDSGAPVPSGTTVTGDGVHLVRLIAPDSSTVPGATPILIDTVTPVVTIIDAVTQRIELHEAAPYATTAAFGPSGPKSITDNGVGGNLDGATVGLHTLTATATSVAGLTGTASQTYRVVYGSASTGFLSPVAPTTLGLNIVVPNLVYGFDYTLVDHAGAPVTSGATTGNTVTYTAETCPSTSYKIQLPKLAGATAQPVSAGGGTYDWDLTTPNSGVLVCDRMTVLANDGYTHFDADLQITP